MVQRLPYLTTLSHDYSSVFTGFLSYWSPGQLSNTVFLLDDRTHCAHSKRHTKCTNCKHSTLGTVSIYYSIQTVHNVYIERNVPFLNTVHIVHNVQLYKCTHFTNWKYCTMVLSVAWSFDLGFLSHCCSLFMDPLSLLVLYHLLYYYISIPLFSSLVSPEKKMSLFKRMCTFFVPSAWLSNSSLRSVSLLYHQISLINLVFFFKVR